MNQTMHRSLRSLYHYLPYSTKTIAASLYGAYLNHWRYGSDTEALISAANDRECWSKAAWKNWQEERLNFILERAATRVPFYRDYWNTQRRNGNNKSWHYLENWPVLEKETLRQCPLMFLAEDCDARKMYKESTSGTTGKPLTLWWSQATVQNWYALFEARWRLWNGVSRNDRWAMLGGQLICPVSQTKPPFWVWNYSLNQLYMSSYHLAPSLLPHYWQAIRKYDIKYIFSYTSSIWALTQYALEASIEIPDLEVVLTNAEPLSSEQKQVMEKVLKCPVRETYGMAEIVGAASECCDEQLHLWPEVGYIELLNAQLDSSGKKIGEMICTGLLNADMPLIRYRVGDRASFDDQESLCTCGRLLPRLTGLEGRTDDLLYARDGRMVGRIDPLFKGDFPIRQAQIIQESLEHIRLKYVPAAGYNRKALENSLLKAIQERLGSMKVTLEPVSQISRTKNGKFRSVISHLSAKEKAKTIYRV